MMRTFYYLIGEPCIQIHWNGHIFWRIRLWLKSFARCAGCKQIVNSLTSRGAGIDGRKVYCRKCWRVSGWYK
jgi:hypothetical protein